MQLDLEIRDGRADTPAALLVHGLGMNRHFWRDPAQCRALGGLASLEIFLARPPAPEEPAKLSTGVPVPGRGLAELLEEQGIGVAAWSQRFPVGPAAEALAELAAVIAELKARWPGRPLYLIGHSRGGLIARHHLLGRNDKNVAGLVTLGTPHAGSRMALFSGALRPAGQLLAKLLPGEAQGQAAAALARLADFLKSPAIEELKPESDFICATSHPLPERLRKLSFGGTDPALFRLYFRAAPQAPWKTITFPELLLKAVPAGRLPAEVSPGRGDGLVSARSAVLAGGNHLDLPCNHVALAFVQQAQQTILDFLVA